MFAATCLSHASHLLELCCLCFGVQKSHLGPTFQRCSDSVNLGKIQRAASDSDNGGLSF